MVIFTTDEETAPARWSAFAAYFAHRGRSCYAMPSSALSGPIPAAALSLLFEPDQMAGETVRHVSAGIEAGLQGPFVLIAAGGIRHLPRWAAAAGACDAIALLSPAFFPLLKLLLAPPAADLWLGYGAGLRPTGLHARSFLRPLRSRVTLHPFQGLDADIAFRPGWERVAHALHLWLESRHAHPRC